MDINTLINLKNDNKELNEEQYDFFVSSYLADKISDEEATKLLKAIFNNGMSEQELLGYTKSLVNSGETITWDTPNNVDKHSTGGVGDKVSIIVAPILKSLDISVSKISGRSLGHTGGTVDKLEAIPNFNPDISKEQFVKLVNENKIAVISQLPELVPGDKKLYSLRDVTGTVSSMPLIAASIMSKKIAAGAKYIILDVKYGSGSFNKTIEDARELGNAMKLIGESFDRKVEIIISSMEQPLGYAIGNGVEVNESIRFLKGLEQPEDLKELIYAVVSEFLIIINGVSKEEAFKLIDESISSGKAYKAFIDWAVSQGASESDIDAELYFQPKFKTYIRTEKAGYINFKDVEQFGVVTRDLLKTGRREKGDIVLPFTGMRLRVKLGDYVEKFDYLSAIYSEKELTPEEYETFKSLFTIQDDKPTVPPIIAEVIKW